MQRRAREVVRCHLCERTIAGEPAATGLFLWTRGSDTRLEEPPLCSGCAATVDMTAGAHFQFGPLD
ncbi:MAG TPA: hypothetical protein ENK23_03550 [Sorangium sp.]|nr:hypothetical protein [Sorangium sp.]